MEAFANLVKLLWLGSSSSVTPRAFKETVGEFASQFRGYDQHDSQEFMVGNERRLLCRSCSWT